MAMDLEPVVSDVNLDSAAQTVVAPFRVQAGGDPAGNVLALYGEADLATAPLLAQALMHASGNGRAQVVLDAEGLEFVDAYCLGIIVSARALLRERGRDLAVRSPAPFLRRLLSLVELEDLIEHTKSAA